MQRYSLTVDKFLEHAAKWSGDQELISASAGQVSSRIDYASIRSRSNRMSGALQALNINVGDRIATLGWNTQHHFEMYYAVMGAGFVCHTLNPRFTAAHLAAIINEAEDRVLVVASNLMALTAELVPLCPTLEHIIVMDEGEGNAELPKGLKPAIWFFENLLELKGRPVAWGEFDEEAPAGLCYTSGTTGKPKGVLYTHRSNYLHTLRSLQADGIALTGADTLLLAVPMFHANGWGLPFAAPAVGAKLVMPGRHTDGASLAKLMRDHRVTVAVGVQTVWLGVIDHLDKEGGELPDLKRVLIGGSKCPEALIKRMEARLGAQVQTSWGMTELSPLGTITAPGAVGESDTSGRPLMGLDLKLTDENGVTLEQQRGVVGHLKVKGPSVVDRYYKAEADALDDEGFFDTGDLASIDASGNLTIRGRSKDLIKSGGEWINPAEIEEIIGRHPSVGLVAVIGRPDVKWGERPVLVVEPRAGEEGVDAESLLDCLRGKVADWWIPDQVVELASIPLAPTGKIDKKKLREDFANRYSA